MITMDRGHGTYCGNWHCVFQDLGNQGRLGMQRLVLVEEVEILELSLLIQIFTFLPVIQL